MPPISFRMPRVLISLGFVLVGAGGLPYYDVASPSQSSYDFYWIVTALGYVVLAWASWVWMSVLSRKRDTLIEMRRVFLLLAAACFVLGIAYLGLINELIAIRRLTHHYGLRIQGISDLLYIVGFGMATFGFWTVARAAVAGGQPGSEPEIVNAAPGGHDQVSG